MKTLFLMGFCLIFLFGGVMYMAKNKHTLKKRCKKDTKLKTTVVEMFLGMLNTVKLYHWNTYSYAEHKATDELYSKLNEHIDTFIEILLGKDECRIPEFSKKILDSRKHDFTQRIHQYREFLINMSEILDPKRDVDLLNVRDELLGDINQFLYLMTFNK
jgi:DNA-binding ferritin-like protein